MMIRLCHGPRQLDSGALQAVQLLVHLRVGEQEEAGHAESALRSVVSLPGHAQQDLLRRAAQTGARLGI